MNKKIDVAQLFRESCNKYKVPFKNVTSIRPPDESTLFTSAGMQAFKDKFMDKNFKNLTLATNQTCFRLNDIENLGDGTHFALFHMLGTFSFRDWTMQEAVDFWLDFIWDLDLKIDYVTIHPDRESWKKLYPDNIEVRLDRECQWSDGGVAGYCTEFYVDGIEVGNIVNPLGDCIDAGFGLERLQQLSNGLQSPTRQELIIAGVKAIAGSGYEPGNKKQGYVLRQLLRELQREGVTDIEIPFLLDEINRQKEIAERYEKLVKQFPNKDKQWWYETHGIEINEDP